MTYVVTRACCSDASCVPACPVNCIHPTPDEPGFAETSMLYIDPDVCIDCGACQRECPVDAIVADFDLTEETKQYLDLNAAYFTDPAHREYGIVPYSSPPQVVEAGGREPLRVAIVGTGPSACYAAEELLAVRGLRTELHLFDRLPTPWGLVRHGVAPDHQQTKQIAEQFARTALSRGVSFHLNVDVGTGITHEDLLAHHHAVIYAVGASQDRELGIPGEHLAGCIAASDLVAWYNGHPEAVDLPVDLSSQRAVIAGNGNVALDLARILLMHPDELARTDAADHAITALAQSRIREVVILGRRGPAQAAYSAPELIALTHLDRIDVAADPGEAAPDEVAARYLQRLPGSPARIKADLAAEIAARPSRGRDRRIVLRYLTMPAEVLGTDRVEGLRVDRAELVPGADGVPVARRCGSLDDLECGLVVRSTGYRGAPRPGLPFDEKRGVIPNRAGRVTDQAGAVLPGVYVAGWAKRGARGVIGTNKACSAETVRGLVDDYLAERLGHPVGGPGDFSALLATRVPDAIGYAGWRAIDRHERALGRSQSRPRTKLVDVRQMLDVAHTS